VKLLKDIASQLRVSEPILTAKVTDEGVFFCLKEKYDPTTIEFDDPMLKFIARHYHETLRLEKRCLVQTTNLDAVYFELIHYFSCLYADLTPLKNPQQSKVFKLLQQLKESQPLRENDDERMCEGLIELYRYIYPNRQLKTHCDNTLAILELMMEKYEEQTNTHQ
jgi:hypothetical protein